MNREQAWLLLPRHIRELPADLAAVLVGIGLTIIAVFVPVINETFLRVIIGLPFVLFIPGYAFIAALFPEAGESPTAERDPPDEASDDEDWIGTMRDRGIDGIERVALSFGLSIAIVPLLGLILNFTPWGIRLVPIVVAVSGFTILCTAIAAIRRWELPPEERFMVPYREWMHAGKQEIFEPDDRLDAALNVALALSIVLAVGVLVFAITVPPQGEQFTEFYILTEDADGDLVAAGYPEEFELGESKPVIIGIGNTEYETVTYTVVIQLQAVEIEGNETQVLEYDELDRFQQTIAHNETWHYEHDITPTMSGENLRVQYLLYKDDPPANPSVDTAYRDLHLWVDVTEPDDTS